MKKTIIFFVLLSLSSCNTDSKQETKIDETQNKIDENIEKVNDMKYGRPSDDDSTSEKEIDQLIDLEKDK